MTAITERMRDTEFAGVVPARGSYPIKANVWIKKGGMVALDSAGRAMPAGLAAGGSVECVGKSSAEYDNRTGSEMGGAAGATNVEVEFGVFAWDNSADADLIGIDDLGVVYVVDDQTVALTNGTDTRIIAGLATEVRNGQVYVWMGPHVFGMIVIAASEASQLDTAQTEIDALQADALSAQAVIPVPLGDFVVVSTGAQLVAFNDGVADGFDWIEGLAYRFNVASTAAIGVTVPMPPDLDDAEDVVIHILASRVGSSDTTAVITTTAFFQTVGAAYDADVNAGGNTGAIAGATTVVSEVTRTIAAADVPAAPAALSFTLVPSAALDADDLRVHAVWLEYTRALRTS
jgi:hypothetical protein